MQQQKGLQGRQEADKEEREKRKRQKIE